MGLGQGKNIASLMGLCVALGACVPAQGPLAQSIEHRAGKSAADLNLATATVFDVVDVDRATANLVASYQGKVLNRRFGLGRGGGSAVIGVGDQLKVTIFEAGTDGLFSTVESKQTAIDLVVQPDGKAAIPYVGQVKFSGRTLEQARQTIIAALQNKAVQPDVIISAVSVASRSVTVSGAVRASGLIPIGLGGDQVTELIAKAGGPSSQAYESYVTLVRGGKTGSVLLKSIIENPSENVYVSPGDQIFVTLDPRTFTVLGETSRNTRVPFGASDLNLLEAIALAGGGDDNRVDAKGYFIFRFEEEDVVKGILGRERFRELLRKGMTADKYGRYPIAYNIDMSRPDSLFVGQNFPVNNRDVIYIARHLNTDLAKFIGLVRGPVDAVRDVSALVPAN